MAGFRNFIIKSINTAAAFVPSKSLQKTSGQKLILPFYHTVSDESMPHIKHLYPVKSTKEFIRDLDFLLGIYEPLDLKQFKDLISKNQQPAKPSFLLTFDDGLREFHDIIAPILLQKGILATAFLNSAFIDNKRLFYRYKASLLINQFIEKPELAANKKVNDWLTFVFKNPGNIANALLSVAYQNQHFLDELADLIQFDFNAFLLDYRPYLSSDQINDLIGKGFHFGAHSIDHPEYQYLDFDEQIRQTKESVEFVYKKFSLEYKVFSFPFTDFGISKHFFDYLQANNIADITFGTAGQKAETIPGHFQRIPFEFEKLTAKQIHNAELLYFLLKAPFGKNTITRK